MTATLPYLGDVYEIHFTPKSFTTIIRYRRGELSRGQEVDYESLPLQLQERIYKRLQSVLAEAKQATRYDDSD